jgi:hypothetical protein
MRKKANPGEIARARREKGRVRDILGDDIDIVDEIGLIHLGGAVGLRISVAAGQRDAAEKLLKDSGVLVPYTFREIQK